MGGPACGSRGIEMSPRLSRRLMLGAGGAAAVRPVAAEDDVIPEWSRTLGEGVDQHPYGKPSIHEKAVIRRDVGWLTASPQSSVNFTPLHALDGIITPNGLCFERHVPQYRLRRAAFQE